MEETMRYRFLGHSGLRVSEAALGTMTFGEDWDWGAPKDEARSFRRHRAPAKDRAFVTRYAR
jgi:aryl-alcohol dehydrogenase-like predicted oxidoreductase